MEDLDKRFLLKKIPLSPGRWCELPVAPALFMSHWLTVIHVCSGCYSLIFLFISFFPIYSSFSFHVLDTLHVILCLNVNVCRVELRLFLLL